MKGVIRKSLGVCAGLLLLVPASALAGTASVEDGIARFDASFGEANTLTVGEVPAASGAPTKIVRFTDAFPITTLGECSHPNPSSARIVDCVVPTDASRVRAGLGNKNDRIEPNATRPLLTMGLSSEGDAGDDTLLGTPQHDVLDGVGGNDDIRGRAGDDGLEGGAGDDEIRGEQGDDLLDGADGSGGDFLDCGAGLADEAVFDLGDTVAANTCEIQTQN